LHAPWIFPLTAEAFAKSEGGLGADWPVLGRDGSQPVIPARKRWIS